MALHMNPGAERAARVRNAGTRQHANAMATWQGGAEAFGVIFRRSAGDFMGDVVTVAECTVAMCVANAPGIAENSKGLCINGQHCVVSGSVVPDASGWATFPFFFEGTN